MNLINEQIVKTKAQFGTPTYLYDEAALQAGYRELREALPTCVDIFYALKVNPNLSLVKLIRSYGGCTEVCSMAEMEIALQAGVAPSDIIFLGPYKTPAEHKRALAVGVYAIVVESETELAKLSKLAQQLGVKAPVAIRINPNFSAAGSPWKMGGRATHLGIEENTAVANFGAYATLPNIDLKGLHVYNGTKILSAQSVYENCDYILSLYDTISERHGLTFSMVDVGGGIGIKYYDNEDALDSTLMKSLLAPLFEDFHRRHPQTRIIMESGRFVIGRAAQLLVTVDNIKSNHGKVFLVTDGGTHCHAATVGSGQVLKRNFPIRNVTATAHAPTATYHVAGPLCNPDDLLGRNVALAEASEGDILAVAASGAYGPSASPVLFHSHGHPAEVLLSKGQLLLIRKRDTVAAIVAPHSDLPLALLLGGTLPEASVTLGAERPGLNSKTQQVVLNALRDILTVAADKPIYADTHLRDELGLDSLSSMELLVSLEDGIDGFGVNADTIEAKHFNTIATLAEYVDQTISGVNTGLLANVAEEQRYEHA